MVLIFCATPYQIFNAVNLKMSDYADKEMCVVVMDYFEGSQILYERVKNSGLFSDAFYIGNKKEYVDYFQRNKKLKNRLHRYRYLSKSKRIVKEIGIDINEIDEIMYAFLNPLLFAMGKEISSNASECVFTYYEDGVGSYLGFIDRINPGKIELLFNVPIRIYIPHRAYLYQPKLSVFQDVVLKKITSPARDTLDILNNIFNFKIEPMNETFIILDSYLNDKNQEYNNLIKRIVTLVGTDNVLVKMHPQRSEHSFFDSIGLNVIKCEQYHPFEILALNQSELTNLCYITVDSTAAFSLKVMCNKEPYVVLLHQIVHDEYYYEYHQKLAMYVEKIKKIYSKEKVFTPRTIEEMDDIFINKLANGNCY